VNAPLAGRVGIVTGAGKGLGRAFALDLAAAGAAVVVNNRNRQVDAQGRGPADHVVAEIVGAGGRAVADHSDVAEPASGRAMVDLALRTFGRLDFLVTSAAVANPEMFHKSTPERFDAVIRTNVGGTAYVAQACSAQLREGGGGHIVLVASTAGLHGEPTASAYSASKGAVIALGRAIAVEGARRGVFTNVLLPYATTQMTDTGMAPQLRDAMDPALTAPVVTALVDPACTLNGQVLVTAGGRLRVASAVEWGTVDLPAGRLSAAALAGLVDSSRTGAPAEFPDAPTAFFDFTAGLEAVDAASAR
jgi:NAD(P)-dependent dehydrogenase (short-subunit alcohol dehydrogenase family)